MNNKFKSIILLQSFFYGNFSTYIESNNKSILLEIMLCGKILPI